MKRIVGRAADRFACNRKENRIKRLLNGPIIRGNEEGAKSGLHGPVMSASHGTGRFSTRASAPRRLCPASWRVFDAGNFARRLPPPRSLGSRSPSRDTVTRFQTP